MRRFAGRPALAAAGLLVACGGGTPAPDPAAATPAVALGGFARRVAPFPVIGPDGAPYPHPFLGGFNQPRPQLVDIDGDGDDDLFVQEATGSVMFFERTPAGFAWRTDRFEDLDVGEWYRFVDVDGDGDADLLAEEPYSYVRYYRNDGTPSEPRFTLAADTLRATDGAALFSDRQNIPNATDIDCDGHMDLLIGRLVGSVTRYEEAGVDPNGVPRFQLLSDAFEGISIVAQIGSAHGANTMALGDIDDDGDTDLFWGDFFEPGVLLLENTGSCASPSLRGEPRSFPLDAPLRTSGYNAPTLGDVDGDGDTDVLVGVLGGAFNPNTTTVDNLHLLEQTAPGRFTDRTARFIGTLDVGSESVPVLVDLDGDGDLDLLVGNKIEQDDTQNGAIYRFVNEGTRTAPRFRADGVLALGGGYDPVPAFGDLDGDGDLDVVLGTWQDALRLYRNDGSPREPAFTLLDSAVVTLPRGRNAVPALGDLDGDGDLDLLVGESSGTLELYRNVGSRTEARFEATPTEIGDIDVGRRSAPTLLDIDGDGDLDLVVGSETEGVRLYRNEGTRQVATFVLDRHLDRVPTFGLAAPALGDLDGDGDLDLLIGGVGGGLWYFEWRGR